MLELALVVLAAAAPKPVVLPEKACVFAAGEDGPGKAHAGRVEVEFARVLKKKGVEMVDLEAQFPPPPPESGEEGEKLFTTGKEAYDNLDFDAAAKALTESALFFIKHPTAAKGERLAEIFVFLGASELQNNNKADGLKDFTRALQMNPGYAPDGKYFGADVLKAYAAAQKDMGSKPKGKVTIDSTPGGAEVVGFGLSYGRTPIVDVELPAGRFMLEFKRDGYAPAAAFPEVVAGQTTAVTQTLQAAPLYMIVHDQAATVATRANFDAPKIPQSGVDLGKDMQARYLVLIDIAGANAEVQVWNVTSGDRLKGVKMTIDNDGSGYDAAADQVEKWLKNPAGAVASAATASGGEEEGEVQPSEGGGVLNKWWFWTAVGVVAVGAGVTTGVVVASGSHGPGGFNTALGQP